MTDNVGVVEKADNYKIKFTNTGSVIDYELPDW